MYFSIFKETFSILTRRYIANEKNNKIGKSSVWTNPGIMSKWGITEIKNKTYKGEKLLSLFIFNPHHLRY